eukprot:GHVT01047456.1.p1 GENE.GHVT01047456.1~~GHVT01047456.1.p1  ORF type:complete len:991 (+),score=215.16 GHVT01047456.1:377-2974(+)
MAMPEEIEQDEVEETAVLDNQADAEQNSEAAPLEDNYYAVEKKSADSVVPHPSPMPRKSVEKDTVGVFGMFCLPLGEELTELNSRWLALKPKLEALLARHKEKQTRLENVAKAIKAEEQEYSFDEHQAIKLVEMKQSVARALDLLQRGTTKIENLSRQVPTLLADLRSAADTAKTTQSTKTAQSLTNIKQLLDDTERTTLSQAPNSSEQRQTKDPINRLQVLHASKGALREADTAIGSMATAARKSLSGLRGAFPPEELTNFEAAHGPEANAQKQRLHNLRGQILADRSSTNLQQLESVKNDVHVVIDQALAALLGPLLQKTASATDQLSPAVGGAWSAWKQIENGISGAPLETATTAVHTHIDQVAKALEAGTTAAAARQGLLKEPIDDVTRLTQSVQQMHSGTVDGLFSTENHAEEVLGRIQLSEASPLDSSAPKSKPKKFVEELAQRMVVLVAEVLKCQGVVAEQRSAEKAVDEAVQSLRNVVRVQLDEINKLVDETKKSWDSSSLWSGALKSVLAYRQKILALRDDLLSVIEKLRQSLVAAEIGRSNGVTAALQRAGSRLHADVTSASQKLATKYQAQVSEPLGNAVRRVERHVDEYMSSRCDPKERASKATRAALQSGARAVKDHLQSNKHVQQRAYGFAADASRHQTIEPENRRNVVKLLAETAEQLSAASEFFDETTKKMDTSMGSLPQEFTRAHSERDEDEGMAIGLCVGLAVLGLMVLATLVATAVILKKFLQKVRVLRNDVAMAIPDHAKLGTGTIGDLDTTTHHPVYKHRITAEAARAGATPSDHVSRLPSSDYVGEILHLEDMKRLRTMEVDDSDEVASSPSPLDEASALEHGALSSGELGRGATTAALSPGH